MAYEHEKPETFIAYDPNENKLYVENNSAIQVADISKVVLIVDKEKPPLWMEQAAKSTGSEIPYPQIKIEIIFNKKGKEKFAKVTANNIGKKCAVFINNELLMAPVIQEKIESGVAQITTGYTESEGRKIVDKINEYIKKNSP